MRIIHTADWHIGQTLAGHSREGEHRAVLAELAGIAAQHQADALLLAGDVFDHHNPSGEAQRLLYDALIGLRRARPGMTIVITAGNHDAAGRLEAPQPLLSALDVHVVGNVRRSGGRIDADRHLVPLRDANGRTAAHVLAVSHPTAACLPAFADLDGAGDGAGSPVVAATRALYEELAEATRPRWQGLPLIVTGHLHVAGGIESEGAERRILVGGQHAVPPDVFPADAAYVALGHLHKAQAIGRPAVRYAGSLLPLSAAEIGYAHGVTVLTLAGGQIDIEPVSLRRPVDFLRVPQTGEAALGEIAAHLAALALPADLEPQARPFVQVRLRRAGLAPGFREEIERLVEPYPVRLVDVRIEAGERPAAGQPADPLLRLAELKPEEMFRRAFERAHGMPPQAGHLAAFHEAAAAAAAEA